MITSSSEHKDLAYQLVNYLVSAQVQKQLSDVTGYIPANMGAAALMTVEMAWRRGPATRAICWRSFNRFVDTGVNPCILRAI